MKPEKSTPLGYVELPDGKKAIYPMYDLLLTYTFEKKEHWEALRLIANLVIEAYRQHMPQTSLTSITGAIEVLTQYKFLLNKQNTTRNQDLRIFAKEGGITYMEMQSRANTDPPIELRSAEYFGLGIGHSKGRPANQIWFLAENVNSLLQNTAFARYILREEKSGKAHPINSGILYVSLKKLSEANSPAGELAAFLLGKGMNPKQATTDIIAKAFMSGFESFKDDKEVKGMLTLRERGIEEGIAIGEAQGIKIGEAQGKKDGIEKFYELMRSGLTADEAYAQLNQK